MILAFNKPYGVLSQFTREAPHHRTLAEFGFPPGVYPVGRLDSDSEGLLLLSDEKKLVDRLLNPRNRHPRTYWSQVEGRPSPRDLLPLERGGILIRDYRTLPCRARIIPGEPDVPPREPPVRYRANIPTAWLELTLVEGKNRQVRRKATRCGSWYPGRMARFGWTAWSRAHGRSCRRVNGRPSCRNMGLIFPEKNIYMFSRIRISYIYFT